MKPYAATLSALILIFSLSCGSARIDTNRASRDDHSNAITGLNEPNVTFEDRTDEVVGQAQRLIHKNAREGAVLSQRWYTLKRLGQYQDAIFSASQIVFYGGLEKEERPWRAESPTS